MPDMFKEQQQAPVADMESAVAHNIREVIGIRL